MKFWKFCWHNWEFVSNERVSPYVINQIVTFKCIKCEEMKVVLR